MNKLPIFHKAGSGNMSFSKGMKDDHFYSLSLLFFILAIVAVFIILSVRLFQLTIVKGEYYRRLSEENRVKELIVESRRGKILDRKGLRIVENTDPNLEEIKDRIATRRVYTEAAATGSILGYRQIADKNDIQSSSCLTKPKLNDKVGKKGIEKFFECQLKGVSGRKLVELDATGKYVRTLSVIEPRDGQTIKLALDLQLQKKAFEAMGQRRGAIIGFIPKTGEVVTFLSSPSYNSQDFEDNKQDAIKKYLSDEEKPLFNRVTEGIYPPGSIIKPFIAAGALQDKKINQKTTYLDEGKIKAGPLEFGNWYFLQYGKTEGVVDVIKAIRRSNDIFFYHVGEKLGPERIKYWSEKFGFGKKTSLPFDQEEGMIPTPFWKEEKLKDRWYLGDSYNLAIGQGYFLVTPLQVAQATSVIANDGVICEPRLLKDGRLSCKKTGLSQKNLDLVKEGMRQACAVGGTGWPFFEFGVREEIGTKKIVTDEATQSAKFKIKRIEVGCKTGTSEAPGESGVPHAWFTVFAPYQDPEIVLTVLVERAGQGSDVAAPIAKEVLKTYFERKE